MKKEKKNLSNKWYSYYHRHCRARENFRGCLPQSSLKNLGQILTVPAISGHLERFSPGQNGPKVGCPVRLFQVIWLPTSEPFWPGENILNQPEIARAVRMWPTFFSDDLGRQPQKFSLALRALGNEFSFHHYFGSTCQPHWNPKTLQLQNHFWSW